QKGRQRVHFRAADHAVDGAAAPDRRSPQLLRRTHAACCRASDRSRQADARRRARGGADAAQAVAKPGEGQVMMTLAAVGNHLWQSTLFVAAVGLAALALRRNSASVRHTLWLAASVKFLVPF